MPGDELRVGVDVGGTFTDVVTAADGSIAVTKTPSTPDAPDEGVLDGLQQVMRAGDYAPAALDLLAHGTTVATNAVLEGTWAETALVTTAGFRDVIEIGRGDRPALYDLSVEKPNPIVPRDRRFEVDERIDERGRVLTALSENEIDRVADEIARADVATLAIGLLFSFENDEHERALVRGLRERDIEIPISCSSVVHPEIREYARLLVTALNASLQPVLASYVDRLRDRVARMGITTPLVMMQSNGGVVGADHLVERPVRGLLSGPAAGVRGATLVAEAIGETDVITMDMGGTSCDVSLVTDGSPAVSTDVTVGEYPVAMPMVDVHTVGAGGGSIAWIDAGGALRVGPRSAGAQPGPICYGRGGAEPTVTDAQVLLGRIDPARISTTADSTPARLTDRFEAVLGEPMDASVEGAAEGVLSVANAAMARAIRVVTVERGFDPRDFALVAYGGAGPLHAARVASSLGIPRVIIPPHAGALSALGLLAADRVFDFAISQVRPIADVDPADLEAQFASFESTGREQLSSAGIPDDRVETERSLELRYLGQAYEVRVPAPAPLTHETLETVAERFHEAHARRYGHRAPSEPVELVTIRLRARGTSDPPSLTHDGPSHGDAAAAPREHRSVHMSGERHRTPIYAREALPVETSITGPAIVEGAGSTFAIPPGSTATVHATGTLLLEVYE